MEKAQQKVRDAVNEMMDSLDKSHLRPLQVRRFFKFEKTREIQKCDLRVQRKRRLLITILNFPRFFEIELGANLKKIFLFFTGKNA